MLYGNIIFIKKTGGDGSKYPVTDKCIKIGRSEECLIRIYNNQVALEHCQLIIGENGQATLKDLSNQTVLNGDLLAKEEVTLCHGDIFKVGERLARWEYLPTSNYYRQLLSPTGHLVAVVMPQQRSLEQDHSTPRTSASFVLDVKKTSVGGKKRSSERFAAENTSAVKMRKSSGLDLIRKTKNVPKFMTGRHSLKSKKLLLSVSKIKDRKSTSGIVNSKAAKAKSRKSTLPSWNMSTVSPLGTMPTRSSPYSKKLTKSTKSMVKNSLKGSGNPEPENLLSNINCGIQTPPKNAVTSEEIFKSSSKNVSKIPLKDVVDSPLKSGESIRSTQSFSESPFPKKPLPTFTPSSKPVRQIHSEKKVNSSLRKSSAVSKKLKRLSLIVTKADKTKRNVDKESLENFSQEDLNSFVAEGLDSNTTVQPTLKNKKEIQVKRKQSPSKVGNPRKVDETVGELSVKKALDSYRDEVKIPRVSLTKKAGEDLAKEKLKRRTTVDVVRISLNELDGVVHLNKERQDIGLKNKSITVKTAPQKLEKSVPKSSCNSKTNSSVSPPQSDTLFSSATSSSPTRSSRSSLRRVPSKKRISSPRGVRRKLSPSISSAERAAKKLKISSPKKPDKNKKAALLVLGKASRKQLLTQNVKVLLKQKIVKKAIKQSTAAVALSNGKSKTDSIATLRGKPKKGLQRNTSKPKLKGKKKSGSSKKNTEADSSKSAEESLENRNKIEHASEEENLGENPSTSSKSAETTASPWSRLKVKNLVIGTPRESSNQFKKSESPRSVPSRSPAKETTSPSGSLDMTAENFLFNSNRRCSKRLSSKNDTGRPDFVELSPTALGLIPKNIEIFKTPKQNKRRSRSLMTPKNLQSAGIIKSTSTPKMGNRKSVRFSYRETSISSEFCSPNLSEKTDFDFGTFQTPDVSVEVFISPLGDKSSAAKEGLSESSKAEEYSELSYSKNNSEPRKCVRKLLQSPQPRRCVSSSQKELSRSSRSPTTKSVRVQKQSNSPKIKDSENKLSNSDVNIFTSPKNSLLDVKEVLGQRSPKNDLSDVRGVKKLLATPKVQKSPRNDLSDVRGVKKLLATPKVQKSPKNDLTDVRGVKKLLATPKVQKSPRNDLSDVRGVKKLLTTPKAQKSPRNDLSDVRGVKKLLATPKVQKSPKNDLSDLRGVKKLLATPKTQKSPRNDLSDVRGVKKLLATPKMQKSPRNDLSDLRGVKKLLATPKTQKSPSNDLTDVTGVKELLRSPRVQKSPKNELLDLSGVQRLLGSPKLRGSLRSESIDLTGATKEGLLDFIKENLVESSKTPKPSINSIEGLEGFSEGPQSDRDSASDLSNVTGVMQLLIAKSPRSVPKSKKTVPRKSRVSDFRAIRGRRTIYSSPKGPKNDLSDLTGVRELFSGPDNEFDVGLTGVAESFDIPEAEAVSTSNVKKFNKKSTAGEVAKAAESTKGTTEQKDESPLPTKRRTRRTLLSKDSAEVTTKRSVRGRRLRAEDEVVTASADRKSLRTAKPNQPVTSPVGVKRSQRIKETKSSGKTSQAKTKAKAKPKEAGEAKTSRKRKAAEDETYSPPSKLGRRRTAGEKETSKNTRSKSAAESAEKTSVRTRRRASAKVRDQTTCKTTSEVQSKTSKANVGRTVKVQNKRSQRNTKETLSDSEGRSSPVKTRNARGRSSPRETTVGRKTPTVKRSSRRK